MYLYIAISVTLFSLLFLYFWGADYLFEKSSYKEVEEMEKKLYQGD